jgi:uncharacterized protein
MIHETIVTTAAHDGRPHIAPMGVRFEDGLAILAPFRPSATLDNIVATRAAVINFTTDVRVFAGCVTGYLRDWPTLAATVVNSVRLADSLAHTELELDTFQDDPQRPVLRMRSVHGETHAPFAGFNRAQAAVVEGAILVSRLSMKWRTCKSPSIKPPVSGSVLPGTGSWRPFRDIAPLKLPRTY